MEQVKLMSAMDIFALHQETFEEAKKKSNDESGNRATYLRFSQDGTYTVRILPLAPVIDAEGNAKLDRKGYEYPVKELVLKIESDKKDANGKPKTTFVNVCNAKYAFPQLPADLIDTYVSTACDIYADDEALCKKLKESSFNGGLKWDSKRSMYVYDLDKRGDGLQILQLSYAQYKELEDRKLKLWAKLSKNGNVPCPLSSINNAYALEVTRKTEKKKTEYSFNIDTLADVDALTETELQELLDAPRLPEVLYRYTRFHLEATIAFLKQTDAKFGIDVMKEDAIAECIETIKLMLPADDQSHFTMSGTGSSASTKASNEDGLDALWNEWQQLEDEGLDDKSDEGRNLRVSIKEYIEDNDLNVTLGRSKTNLDLLNEIEDALAGDAKSKPEPQEEEEEEEDDEPATVAPSNVEEEEDDEPAEPAPVRRPRNEDTNEPALRTERRSSRPARRRQ